MSLYNSAVFSLDDLELIDDEIVRERKKRNFRTRMNPLTYYSDSELVERFRMNRDILEELFELVGPTLKHQTARNHAIHPMTQMLIAIYFLVTGDHFTTIGDVFHIHKSTVSRCISRVIEAFLPHVGDFVKMPEPNSDELEDIRTSFYNKTSLSKIIGAIDGTHIEIMRPSGEPDAPYINRKSYPSINVFACCDHLRRIRYIQAKFPGSCHDSSVMKSTNFFDMLESGKYNDSIILGDSGYGQREWLFVPVRFPQNDAEVRYNTLHRVTRVIIEQCFGVLKRRFMVLHSEVRLEPGKVCKIVAVCAMLHNIATDRGLNTIENMDDQENDADGSFEHHRPLDQREHARVATARRIRDDYINRVVRSQMGT